jgi:ABC-type glycerol-3-phosphate transport system permease component
MLSTSRNQQMLFNLIIFLALSVGAIIAIAPMLYMVSTAFKGESYVQEIPPRFLPEHPTFENFEMAYNSRNFGRAFMNSGIVAISTAILVTTLSSLMAYAFARFEFAGKNILFNLLLLILMIPGIVLLIPQFILAKNLQLLNSLWGLVVVYFRVMLPLAAPAVSTVAVFSFLGAWDEYILALNFLTDESLRTLPIAIANFRGQHATNWGLVFAGSLTAVVPTVLLFIFFQRYFIQGLTQGAVRG